MPSIIDSTRERTVVLTAWGVPNGGGSIARRAESSIATDFSQSECDFFDILVWVCRKESHAKCINIKIILHVSNAPVQILKKFENNISPKRSNGLNTVYKYSLQHENKVYTSLRHGIMLIHMTKANNNSAKTYSFNLFKWNNRYVNPQKRKPSSTIYNSRRLQIFLRWINSFKLWKWPCCGQV